MRIAIDLSSAGTLPLAAHPLCSRWLQEPGLRASDPPFDLVKPVSLAGAQHVWSVLRQLLDPTGTTLDPAKFRAVIPLDAAGDAAELRRWLHDSLPRDTGDLTLAWSPQLAATVPPDAFFEHWDTFCRPGADDLIVWSADDRWAAFYRHGNGRLFVGNRRHQP